MHSKGIMEIEYKKYKNNPPHLFIENAKYFITASTLGKYPYLKSDDAKWAAIDYLSTSLEAYDWTMEDWVILDNHIHIMVNAPDDAKTLSKVMNNFHRFTANWLSKNNIKKIDGKYFHNYWDTCITYDNSYFTRINYIWYNPVKHGYVETPEEWKFGSYYYRIKKEADEMGTLKKKYPFDKVKISDEF